VACHRGRLATITFLGERKMADHMLPRSGRLKGGNSHRVRNFLLVAEAAGLWYLISKLKSAGSQPNRCVPLKCARSEPNRCALTDLNLKNG
jgi:hypothetical protein